MKPARLTYIVVKEVSLVSVVQMNELSRQLHLTIHPRPYVPGAGDMVAVHTLPMPTIKREKREGCVTAGPLTIFPSG